MSNQLPHIVVNKNSITKPYVKKVIVPTTIPERDTHAHGSKLLHQFSELESVIERNDFIDSSGVIVEFDLKKSGSEPLFSLDNTQFHLLSSRIVEDFIRAEVYVSKNSLSKLKSKFSNYLEDQHKSKPRDKNLINHINNIRPARLESLWGDDPSDFPIGDDFRWWEIWLRYDLDARPESILTSFLKEVKMMGIEVTEFNRYKNYVIFPERIVTNIKANKTILTRAIYRFPEYFAEIRLPYTLSSFVCRDKTDSKIWLENIEERIVVKDIKKSPAICLLDTGVNHQHPLLKSVFDERAILTVSSCNTTSDQNGHGTLMAGIAAYGDLSPHFHHNSTIEIMHHIESMKIIRNTGDESNNTSATLENAVTKMEGLNKNKIRHYSLAVTAPNKRTYGMPTAASAVIDKLSFNVENPKRLFIVSAGNIYPQGHWYMSVDPYARQDIHDPGQAWNALTVGAFAHTDYFEPKEHPKFKPICKYRDLSPVSTTSISWKDYAIHGQWPYKPDVVFPGGNAITDHRNEVRIPDEMSVISTSKNFHLEKKYFDFFGDTSAATAEAARMAARISAEYPNLWPETVRALIVHSADWSNEMKAQFSDKTKTEKVNIKNLLRYCGYGIPSLSVALNSLQNRLTLIFQDELQPFEQIKINDEPKFKDMNLHEIPWPKELLRSLGNDEVSIKITLSYFIDPNPSTQVKTHQRYSYECCGLRFSLKRSTESLEDFIKRKSKHEKSENGSPSLSETTKWLIGTTSRTLGSLHSDTVTDYATNLANCNYIIVHPTTGWWKLLRKKEHWKKKIRYSLVVTIQTKNENIDLYTPVKILLQTSVGIEI